MKILFMPALLSMMLASTLMLGADDMEKKKFTLFDDFTMGSVVFRDGSVTQGLLNYDLGKERFLLKENEDILLIDITDDIAYISVGGRFFQSMGDGAFYEKIAASDDKTEFYVLWRAKVTMKGNQGAYGTVSQTSSIRSQDKVYGSSAGRAIQLDYSDVESVVPGNRFYIKVGESFKPFYSAKTLAKIFKKGGSEIEDYAKNENIDFQSVDDVKKMVAFCAQFM